MLNTQETKQTALDQLPLMEDFYTVQGEGHFQGHAAYFIRLGGCDVGCHWCDVKESWREDHPVETVKNMIHRVENARANLAVITGGEPLMHDLTALTEGLQKKNIRTHIETSGTHPLTGTWDWICFSPKKFKKPLKEIWNRADELKVVIFHPSDLAWAETQALKVRNGCKLYLQPEWSRYNEMMPLIVEYVKNNPRWEISLQIHKFMNIP